VATKKASSKEPEKTKKSQVSQASKAALEDKVAYTKRGSALNPYTNDVFQQAATLIQYEKRAYEDANRSIKSSLKKAYKNYLGIFDQPYDTYTKRKKIFSPLTHDIVDSISKPVQITAKSIKFLPLTDKSRGKAKLLNMVMPYFFQVMDFDKHIETFKHRVAMLGTQVSLQDWVYQEDEMSVENDPTEELLLGLPEEKAAKKKTKKVVQDRPRITNLDIMDLFMPATAESIQWAVANASVIYRDVCTADDIRRNPNYSEEVRASIQGRTIVSTATDDSTSLMKYSMSGFSGPGAGKVMQSGETEKFSNPVVARYRRFGKVPKSWITGDEADGLISIDAIIEAVASDSTEYNFETLSIRPSPFGAYGPFEDCRFNILPKRYYGEGVGERLIPYQIWHNEVINNRRNNEMIVQHRMFITKKGKVDTRQLFARPGGAIEVENPTTDIIPLATPDIAGSSFGEDNYILSGAQRLAGVAMTPINKKATATEINNIQANANVTSNEYMGALEQYLEGLVLHHVIPLCKRYFSDEKAIPITMSAKEMEQLDTYNGYRPFTSEEANSVRFLLVDDPSLFDGEFAVTVDIEGSGQNRAQQAAVLTQMMTLASKIQGANMNLPEAFRKLAELSGISDDRLFNDAAPTGPTGVTNPQVPGMAQMMAMAGQGGTQGPPPQPSQSAQGLAQGIAQGMA